MVPFRVAREIHAGFEGLGFFALFGRDALHRRTFGDQGRFGRPFGRFNLEAEVSAGRYPRAEFIPNGARQLQQRAAFRGGAQKALVGNPFLVKGQNIRRHRPGIQKRNGGVILLARGQIQQRFLPGVRPIGDLRPRQVSDHAGQKFAVHPQAIIQAAQAVRVVMPGRFRLIRAAIAGVQKITGIAH
ncbi:MAG TPA: hypothetical protein DEH25_00125 [Chloroflexi bacterium]|nr:hypothetical protein [Chloroflexota bacterium]